MAYPDNKETFRRVINQELPDIPGDTVDENDQNLPANFLERLQDTFGYNIKMGYTTVKEFFDWLLAQISTITNKVDKAGDTMTGNLTLNNSTTASPILYTLTTAGPSMNIKGYFGGIIITGKDRVEIQTSDNGLIMIIGLNNELQTLKKINMTNNEIYDVSKITIRSAGTDYINLAPAKGLVVKTPDGTKDFRISVDNAGNIISTFL